MNLRKLYKRLQWLPAMVLVLCVVCWKMGSQVMEEASSVKTEKPKIALTFDDGPHPIYTKELSKELAKRGVKASFFLLGERITGNEEAIKQLEQDGHLIGNHGYQHVVLTSLPKDEACTQILKTCKLIYGVTGTYPSYIRPPYGEWDEELDCGVQLIPVFWTIDSRDWDLKNTDAVVKKVMGDVEEGDIILMHDSYDTTVKAALEIVDELLDEGYEFVTVDELIDE